MSTPRTDMALEGMSIAGLAKLSVQLETELAAEREKVAKLRDALERIERNAEISERQMQEYPQHCSAIIGDLAALIAISANALAETAPKEGAK